MAKIRRERLYTVVPCTRDPHILGFEPPYAVEDGETIEQLVNRAREYVRVTLATPVHTSELIWHIIQVLPDIPEWKGMKGHYKDLRVDGRPNVAKYGHNGVWTFTVEDFIDDLQRRMGQYVRFNFAYEGVTMSGEGNHAGDGADRAHEGAEEEEEPKENPSNRNEEEEEN